MRQSLHRTGSRSLWLAAVRAEWLARMNWRSSVMPSRFLKHKRVPAVCSSTAFRRSNSRRGSSTAASTYCVGAVFGTTDRAPVRVGVMYRKGASFEYRTMSGRDPERSYRFRVPDRLWVGASVQPVKSADGLPVLTLAADVTRVTYSRLREDFIVDQTSGVGRAQDFLLDDGTELHFGVQYWPTLSHGAPQFRGGVWFDPDHSVKFEAQTAPATPSDRLFDEAMGVALSTGKNLLHYTGGVGFSLTPRFEINAAVDLTSRSRVVSASIVVR